MPTIEITGCFTDKYYPTRALANSEESSYWIWASCPACFVYASNELEAAKKHLKNMPDPLFWAYILYERDNSIHGFIDRREIARKTTTKPEYIESPRSA